MSHVGRRLRRSVSHAEGALLLLVAAAAVATAGCGSSSSADAQKPTAGSSAGGTGGSGSGGTMSGGGATDELPAGLTEHIIDPSDTGPGIESAAAFGSHYAYTSDAPAKGKLFVFLAASGGNPSQYLLVERAAASAGFHSLGLAYPNADVVDVLCMGTSDVDCEKSIHQETLTGDDTSDLVSVTPANSIENRVVRALAYLKETYPDEGWDAYTSASGSVSWDAVTLSGHSQGGGHAAYVASKHAVDRICTFSSPADWNAAVDNGNGGPAPWLSEPSATPATRFYGFGHQADLIVPWTRLQAIWAALGLAGPTVDVLDVAPPYDDSHMLYTFTMASSVQEAKIYNHSSTVGDFATPIDSSGVPEYLPVWQYACFQ